MRPRYESESDRANQQAVIDVCCREWDVTARALPVDLILDYSVRGGPDNDIRAWIEVKCRTAARDSYSTLILSKKKVDYGVDLFKSTGALFVLVVRWAGEAPY